MIGALALCSAVAAFAEPEVPVARAAPFRAEASGAAARRTFALDHGAAAALEALDAVRLLDFPAPDGSALTLDLRRTRALAAGAQVSIGGRPQPAGTGAARVSTWSGRVAGEADSLAFLALSPLGTRGFVRRGARTIHLLGLPDAAGRPASDRFAVADGAALPPRDALASCGARGTPQAALGLPRGAVGKASGALVPLAQGGDPPHFTCRIAVETDWAFFQLFQDSAAAEVYATTLLAAVSALYESEIGLVLDVRYLGLHDHADGAWAAVDMFELLGKFEQAWGDGKAPVPTEAHLFLSGALLGGGVAEIDSLCDPDRSFAVASHINGWLTDPPTQGPLTWDFYVAAHELGHLLGTVHTHQYCPPLDLCAPPWAFGSCQFQWNCSPGTIMSYCHQCFGGMNNIQLENHPAVKARLRETTAASCLPFSGFTTLCVNAPAELAVPAEAGPPIVVQLAEVAKCDETGQPLPFAAGPKKPAPWLSLQPASGSLLEPGTPQAIAIALDPIAAGKGIHTTKVRIAHAEDPTQSTSVKVRFEVVPTAFQLGQPIAGKLDAFKDADFARFFGVAGARARIQVNPSPLGLEAKVRVRDPKKKNVVGFSVLGLEPESRDIVLKRTGWHQVEVRGLNFSTGTYSIATELLELPPSALPRHVEQTASGKKPYADFPFSALPGSAFAATVAALPPLPAPILLELRGPSGSVVPLAADASAGQASVAGIVLAAGGNYRLRVLGLAGNPAALAVDLAPTPPAIPLDVAFMD